MALLARESFRAALILILILNILFFPCIWGHKSLLDSAQARESILRSGAWAGSRVTINWPKSRDAAAAAWFFEPSLALTGYEYTHEKVLPLWNPYQGYGAPFAADMQSQPFYPLTILVSLHLTPRTYNLYLLARLFVAGFFTYLFLRLFVSFVPALGGGIAAMLGGYYILYITMPHLSVEILIPAALLTAEQLLRNRSYRSFLAFTAILFLAILGGMPESSLLLFVLLYPYILFRILSDKQLRSAWIPLTIRIALSTLAGLGLSCILLLPFLEFMRHAYDAHQPHNIGGAIPGLYHYAPDSSVLRYFFPLIFGPYGFENEFGLVAFFLVLVALLTAFRRTRGVPQPGRRSFTFFFFAYSLLLILKRYGILVNNIGRLPLFQYIDFYKYDEAILSICVAVLCGLGLDRLFRAETTKTVLAAALGISFAMLPLAAVLGQNTVISEIKTVQLPVRFPELALGIPASALFCVAISLILFQQNQFRVSLSIATVLVLELSLNYIPALYYFGNSLPDQLQDPYAGAPYIHFLKERGSHFERIFARDAVLYPDWPSAFQLQDIRDLDAMYYWKYLPFVRNFIIPESPAKTQELWNRFTGSDGGEYAFKTPLERRLLQLSSVKYLVSTRPYLDVPFQPVYDHEVKMYEYDNVLPRAAVYYRAEVVRSESEALKRLAAPNFDVFQTVIINMGNPGRFSNDIARVNEGAARRVEAATIVSYQSQAVEIRALLGQTGVLVLNDSGYPGWAVTVDGAPTKWVTANYLFRGVLLPPGKHVVKFMYRPRTFYLGSAIALTALLGLLYRLALPMWSALRVRVGSRSEPIRAVR